MGRREGDTRGQGVPTEGLLGGQCRNGLGRQVPVSRETSPSREMRPVLPGPPVVAVPVPPEALQSPDETPPLRGPPATDESADPLRSVPLQPLLWLDRSESAQIRGETSAQNLRVP